MQHHTHKPERFKRTKLVRTFVSPVEQERIRAVVRHYGLRSAYQLYGVSIRLVLHALEQAMQDGADEQAQARIRGLFVEYFDKKLDESFEDKPTLFDSLYQQEEDAKQAHMQEVLPKVNLWARQWVQRHYERLRKHYASLDQTPYPRTGETILDIFEGKVESLFYCREPLANYKAFEAWALEKFHHLEDDYQNETDYYESDDRRDYEESTSDPWAFGWD